MYGINQTHDAELTSWVESANQDDSHFAIQNLPYGVFRPTGSNTDFRIGVAIGDHIVDMKSLCDSGLIEAGGCGDLISALKAARLNELADAEPARLSALRALLSRLLQSGAAEQAQVANCLVEQSAAEYRVPFDIADYTDFYTSIHHATAIGSIFRPDNPLLPNYKWIPIGYHGRASSIEVSGQVFLRPWGQLKAPDAAEPVLGPCKRLDYELEMAIYIGRGNKLGQPISMEEAEGHVFGLSILNDWSARDIQGWEYQPLGPFLAKNFASTVSPWVITAEALAPFRSEFTRPESDPQPLPYLSSDSNSAQGSMDIQLEVLLETPRQREAGEAATRLSSSNFRDSYWTVAQMVTHHTVNGCNLQPGDLLGSGTQSGPTPEEGGSLMELSNAGKTPIELPGGETRTFLEDGDGIYMRGWCERDGFRKIGFGEVYSQVEANDR